MKITSIINLYTLALVSKLVQDFAHNAIDRDVLLKFSIYRKHVCSPLMHRNFNSSAHNVSADGSDRYNEYSF